MCYFVCSAAVQDGISTEVLYSPKWRLAEQLQVGDIMARKQSKDCQRSAGKSRN
jgi:hypothetical protein